MMLRTQASSDGLHTCVYRPMSVQRTYKIFVSSCSTLRRACVCATHTSVTLTSRTEVEQRRLIIHANPNRAANPGDHPGRYNRATGFKEVCVYMSDSAYATQPRDIALRLRDGDGAVQLLSETHRSCDPLHYPTLFPAGDYGWHLQLLRHLAPQQQRRGASQFVHDQASAPSQSDRRVTAREYYAYRLHQRSTSSDILF
jgi:hypothetical protein